MSQAVSSPDARRTGPSDASGAAREGRRGEAPCYAALDLGTNNCRLLIAAPSHAGGFRIVEAYSRIVRLGEGLTATGRLQEPAMERALAALKTCAERIGRRRVAGVRAIATQACRAADNGAEFIERVRLETGLSLDVITPKEEAQLSVAGCLNLFDTEGADAALVVDVGGGSTELSWVDLTDPNIQQRGQFNPRRLPIRAWLSMPVGVVSLAERFPEREDDPEAWFQDMVDDVKNRIEAFPHAEKLRETFARGRTQLVGTSGAITSLAGVHLALPRYDRTKVDGLWMSEAHCRSVTDRLLSLTQAQRAEEPCIGPDRADLVLAGAAILRAVQESWPCTRSRVADRGLREGLLLSLMSPAPGRKRRRRGGRNRPAATSGAAA